MTQLFSRIPGSERETPKTLATVHPELVAEAKIPGNLRLICVKLCSSINHRWSFCRLVQRQSNSSGKAMQRDEVLTDRLRKHVERLAGDIGERNLFVPDALQRAAQYIEDE